MSPDGQQGESPNMTPHDEILPVAGVEPGITDTDQPKDDTSQEPQSNPTDLRGLEPNTRIQDHDVAEDMAHAGRDERYMAADKRAGTYTGFDPRPEWDVDRKADLLEDMHHIYEFNAEEFDQYAQGEVDRVVAWISGHTDVTQEDKDRAASEERKDLDAHRAWLEHNSGIIPVMWAIPKSSAGSMNMGKIIQEHDIELSEELETALLTYPNGPGIRMSLATTRPLSKAQLDMLDATGDDLGYKGMSHEAAMAEIMRAQNQMKQRADAVMAKHAA